MEALIDENFGDKKVQILMLGLKGAGKTTILHKLQLGALSSSGTDTGTSVETVKHKNTTLVSWDIGWQPAHAWRALYPATRGLVLVVDASDEKRLVEASAELKNFLAESQLGDVALLVLANKDDLFGAAGSRQVTRALKLRDVKHAEWNVQSASAASGDGLCEGFAWLCEKLKSRV